MKVSSIGLSKSNILVNQKHSNKCTYAMLNTPNNPETDTVSFNGIAGKVRGGVWGAFILGSISVLTITGLGPLATAGVVLASEIGGAYIGGKIGDKVTKD